MIQYENGNPVFPPSQSSLFVEDASSASTPLVMFICDQGGAPNNSTIDGGQVDNLIAALSAWRAAHPAPSTAPIHGDSI